MELTGTHLKYLLRMYQISSAHHEEMRLTEIANKLGVKKASVARIIGVFRDKNLVEQQLYGKVRLTEHGRKTAEQYLVYIHKLTECLMQSGLELTTQQAMDAACILLPELPPESMRNMQPIEVVSN
ncbi:MAG: helix-turn-helix domain-containing protein [Eubacteriales bacterium]|nr:helix-turn-helix domain-containing protein [Eubacteriales bacterium]